VGSTFTRDRGAVRDEDHDSVRVVVLVPVRRQGEPYGAAMRTVGLRTPCQRRYGTAMNRSTTTRAAQATPGVARWIPLAVALSLVAAGCKEKEAAPPAPAVHPSASSSPVTSSSAPPVASSPPAPPSAPAGPATTGALATEYRGTIGDGLAVVVRLARTTGRVTGSYFYEKAGAAIEVKGSLSGSHLALDEVIGSLKTGSFAADLADDGSLTGAWTGTGKQRSLDLHLTPIALPPVPSTALVFRRARRDVRQVAGKKAKDEVCRTEVEYAEVFGLRAEAEARINARLAPAAEVLAPAACDHAVGTTAGYKVLHNKDGILSVDVSGSVADSQAAHPDAWAGPVTVLLSTGEDARLFGDVLAKEDEPAVRRELTAAVDRLTREAGADADTKKMVMDSFGDAPSFEIDRTGLRLCASTPHFAANLGGCQYVVPASKLPRSGPRAAAIWGK